MSEPCPIVIPLHPGGGKLGDDTEAKFAVRSIAKHFKGEVHLAMVAGRLPQWANGVEHIQDGGKGLKTALRKAAERFPDGFFWWYDDCHLLVDQTPEQIKVTLACPQWRHAKTAWARNLEKIHHRLESEGFVPWDYSRPHGPYWYDKGMIDEAFNDWPGMAGKFPFESWILSKRNWPRKHGRYRQYYGKFKRPPASTDVYLNFNNRGFTAELRTWLENRFQDRCRFEREPSKLDGPRHVSVLDLESRPRWGAGLVRDLSGRGFKAELFWGEDGKPDWLQVNWRAFKRAYRRMPYLGEQGCYASHVKLAREMAAGRIPQFIDGWWVVCEDDAKPSHDMNSDRLRDLLREADGRFDFVMLHPGRKGHRAGGSPGVRPRTKNKFGTEFGTFAYAVSVKGADVISRFIMRHPIDTGILASRRLRVGVLWGTAHFTHPEASLLFPAIRWEREKIQVIQQRPEKFMRVIHQVWIQGEKELPEEYARFRKEWAEAFPDWEMVLWDGAKAASQWPDFAEASPRCAHHATRADIILARAIRDFGGLALGADCSVKNAEALKTTIGALDSMLVITPGFDEISNGLQWCAKAGHPFWNCVCRHQLREGGRHLGRKSVSEATGPKCYAEAFKARMWELGLVTAPKAFTRDWAGRWTNPEAFIDPGFAGSWK